MAVDIIKFSLTHHCAWEEERGSQLPMTAWRQAGAAFYLMVNKYLMSTYLNSSQIKS